MKRTIFSAFGISGLIIFIICAFCLDVSRRYHINEEGLVKLNLHLVGIVDSVDDVKGFNNCGIVFLKVIDSNIPHLLSHDTKFYYCVINNGRAELFTECDAGMKGSILTLDTKTRTISYTSKGKPQKGSIGINSSVEYQNYIKKHSILLNE